MYLAENENPQVWKNSIYKAIYDIADIDFQRITWSGNDTNIIFSFTEALSTLYDDFDFERFLKYYKSKNNENRLYKLLTELNKLISEYEDYGYETEMEVNGYNKILNDQNWIKITKKANEILIEWNKSNA